MMVVVDLVDPYALGFPVVALVTSVGGLDALTQVLQPLPADLLAAVLVVQHLQPDAPVVWSAFWVSAPR